MQKEEELKAYQVLSQPQTFKQLRSDASFLDKLALNPTFLKDILDISFRPKHFQKVNKVKLTPDMPATAIEALCSLYQDLLSLLTYDKIVQKDASLQGFEMQEQQPKKQEEDKEQFIYLSHIHLTFEDPQTDDASISNLSRILGPIYYHSPQKVMRFYQNHDKQKEMFLSCLWHRGVMEIFCKLLEAESGKQFFKEYKTGFLNRYYSYLKENLSKQSKLEWLQNLLQLHKFVMQKMQQRYDGTKYISLLETINQNDCEIIQKTNQLFQDLSDQTALVYIRLCQQILKKDSFIWGSTQLRVPVTSLNRKYSISNSFYDDTNNNKKKAYHLSPTLLICIGKALEKIKKKYVTKQQKGRTLQMIDFFKAFYFWVKVVIASNQTAPDAKTLLQTLVNKQFLDSCFDVARSRPNCTSLHNYIKEFIMEALILKVIPIQYFCWEECPYLKVLTENLPKKQNAKQSPLGNQSYHIYNQVIKIKGELPGRLSDLLAEQKLRREKVIGGRDPRKFHQSRRGSNAFSESSEECLQIDIPSLKSNFSEVGLNNPLKLGTPLSIEHSIEEENEKNQEGQNNQS